MITLEVTIMPFSVFPFTGDNYEKIIHRIAASSNSVQDYESKVNRINMPIHYPYF